MRQEIQLTLQAEMTAIKRIFEQYIPKEKLEGYRLQAGINDEIIVGMSGGADSTVVGLFVAAYLCPIYSKITFLFTDTGAEPVSCHETLNKFEALTFQPIKRVKAKRDFFEALEDNNGFLPSPKQRWCTNLLKIAPLKTFIENQIDGKCWNIAGIRADEADREGITLIHNMENDGKSIFPFVDLGVTKKDVFRILQRTIGIPSTYRYRTRSGCFLCLFSRQQEYIGMMLNDPLYFKKTEALEKLSDSDLKRFPTMDNFQTNHGLNVPNFVDIRTLQNSEILPYKRITAKAKKVGMDDLFGEQDHEVTQIFVAHAIYVEPMLSWYGDSEFTPGSYGAEFITFSTSMNGLNTSLANYYAFKSTTPDPRYNIKQMKIVISHITFKKGLIDTQPPSSDSYTWKSNVALKQMRHIVSHALMSLAHKKCTDELTKMNELVESTNDEDIYLQADESIERLAHELSFVDKQRVGDVQWQGLYRPVAKSSQQGVVQFDLEGIKKHVEVKSPTKKKAKNLEFDEVPKACVICSI